MPGGLRRNNPTAATPLPPPTNHDQLLKRLDQEISIAQDEREDLLGVIQREYFWHSLRADELAFFLRGHGIDVKPA
jgi:hypothetical protein